MSTAEFTARTMGLLTRVSFAKAVNELRGFFQAF